MTLIELTEQAHDDTCPCCGEGIDWEAGDHVILAEDWHVACHVERATFDIAVLDTLSSML